MPGPGNKDAAPAAAAPPKIAADFALVAAAVNLKRLAVLNPACVSESGRATATG